VLTESIKRYLSIVRQQKGNKKSTKGNKKATKRQQEATERKQKGDKKVTTSLFVYGGQRAPATLGEQAESDIVR
jgi:hypothetical protein